MKSLVCTRLACAVALVLPALAQTGTLDQVSPYPPTPPVQTAGFNGSASSLIWQQQVKTGIAGQLEGFQLYVSGPQGSSMDVRLRRGNGWNTSPVVFSTVLVKPTSNALDIVFVNCSAANQSFVVGETFVIEVQGQNNNAGFSGSYAPPPQTPAYSEDLYLDPGQPSCFADCHWRMGFNTFVLTGPPAPVEYCTSGTTTNGCSAAIHASANPRVAHNQPCTINVQGLEGQKSGILFYALQSLPQPWCVLGGGTSFLCVKPPTQRTVGQSSGGTANQCNGQLALDWNAFQLANPTALGNPWSAGAKVFVQGWFRDPPACKTTALSNAVELTYLP